MNINEVDLITNAGDLDSILLQRVSISGYGEGNIIWDFMEISPIILSINYPIKRLMEGQGDLLLIMRYK